MQVDIYTANGEKKGKLKLSDTLFGAKINVDLMHRAVVMRNANRRQPVAHTLTRGEVSATTKKAFRQKGTGNARRGARSTNLLRGGGVTHGPRNDRNFSKAMPRKERRAALYSALTVKAGDKSVFGLESLSYKLPKTKDFSALLGKLPQGKKYLFVLAEKDEIFEKSARNIPGVTIILAAYLNPFDVLKADQVCFVGDAQDKAVQTFTADK